MGKNRLEEIFRDPTLEAPPSDHFVVRTEWGGFLVTRETAERILTAMSGNGPVRILRIETLFGSVAFLRSDQIVFVRESTRSQRKAEERFWKMLDDEENEDDDKKERSAQPFGASGIQDGPAPQA